MKFSKSTFEITKRYAEELQTKLDVFQAISKTNKTLFLTMVTTYGIKNKSTHLPLIQHDITMEVLFLSHKLNTTEPCPPSPFKIISRDRTFGLNLGEYYNYFKLPLSNE